MTTKKTSKPNVAYTFKINGVGATPPTLPMRDLAAYLTVLAGLFGNADHVHFQKIVKGSACPKIMVDRKSMPEVRSRLRTASRADAPAELVHLRETLNNLLGRDHRHAVLKEPDGSNVILFPGVRTIEFQEVTIREAGVLHRSDACRTH